MLAIIVAVWYAVAVCLNAPLADEPVERDGEAWTCADSCAGTLSQDRPVLPAPHQVAVEIWNTTVGQSVTSRRSLVYHAWVTLSATLLGFVIGTLLGIAARRADRPQPRRWTAR